MNVSVAPNRGSWFGLRPTVTVASRPSLERPLQKSLNLNG